MKHLIVVTGLVLAAPLAVACAEHASPPTSAQKAANQAEQASQKAQKEAAEARKNAQVAQQKDAEAQQNLRAAQAQEAQANQRAQQASHGAGFAEEQAGYTGQTGYERQAGAAAPSEGAAEAQAGGAGGEGQANAGKVVVVTVGLLFPTNSSQISPAAKPKLDEVAKALLMNPEANNVTVQGFTDDTGDPASNKALSKLRAQAVADYLQSKGIPKDRVTTKGLGEEHPVSGEKTNEGRAMNRRVEIVIQPASAQPSQPSSPQPSSPQSPQPTSP
jgi:outer membrane protein OmpA-like peptidoglycan-associated protein